ncbi:MAG: hypothetical protein ACOC4G_15120 [Bacillota bacterium]
MNKRECPDCGYKVGEEFYFRCPRCNRILIEKCSECEKCDKSITCFQKKTD